MAAAMGELLVYAENFYRRFPEEFLALGAPGLEEIFDLRPHGTRSRRISESPAEKTVEITIRRWQAPSMPPVPPALSLQAPSMPPVPPALSLQANYAFPGASPFQAAYPGHPALVPPAAFSAPAPGLGGSCSAAAAAAAATAPGAAAFGAWPRPAWPQDLSAQAAFGALPPWGACAATAPAPAAAPAAAVGVAPQPVPTPEQQQPQHANGPSVEATYVNTQLSRLESALELIKPQIEAALAGRAKAQAPASSAAAASSSSGPAAALGTGSDHSPSSPLRERRKLTGLSIVKPEAFATQEPAKNVLQAPAVKELTKTASASSEIAAPMEAKLQSSEGCISSGAQGSSLKPAAAAVQQVEGQQGHMDEARNKGKEHIRPRAVNAVRVASSIMDPESPRSPGKYSAWK